MDGRPNRRRVRQPGAIRVYVEVMLVGGLEEEVKKHPAPRRAVSLRPLCRCMKGPRDNRREREPRNQRRSSFKDKKRRRRNPDSSKEGEGSIYKRCVGPIRQGVMKWLPAMSAEEGVEGMATRG